MTKNPAQKPSDNGSHLLGLVRGNDYNRSRYAIDHRPGQSSSQRRVREGWGSCLILWFETKTKKLIYINQKKSCKLVNCKITTSYNKDMVFRHVSCKNPPNNWTLGSSWPWTSCWPTTPGRSWRWTHISIPNPAHLKNKRKSNWIMKPQGSGFLHLEKYLSCHHRVCLYVSGIQIIIYIFEYIYIYLWLFVICTKSQFRRLYC